MTVERLREVMAAVGTEPNARELAEALWLAHQLAERPAPAAADAPRAPAGPSVPPALPSPARPPRSMSPPTSPRPPMPGRRELHPPAVAPATGQDAVDVAVPEAPALDARLDYQRALRPLMRRVPSRRVEMLDEDATARLIADQPPAMRAWTPVLRPSLERWLDAALVFDDAGSMRIWRRLAQGVAGGLAESGVFRDVTFWRLNGSTSRGEATVSTSRGSPRSAAELIDPTGRRVILVLSDCVGPAWRSGAAAAILHRWSLYGPVAILQPLPERLWARTAAPTVPGSVSAARPCVPNAKLSFTPFDGMDYPAGATAVPVMEIAPRWLARWTRLVAGGSAQTSAVTFVAPGMGRPHSIDPPLALTPQERVRYFRAAASPEAFRLAGYLAMAVPVLPIMRHVHKAMFRPALPAHLAEVVLSGLLRMVDAEDERYEFVGGVAELLLNSLTRSEMAQVGQRLSAGIESRAGTTRDYFRGLLAGEGDRALEPSSRAIAFISPQGQDRLRLISRGPRAEGADAVPPAEQSPPGGPGSPPAPAIPRQSTEPAGDGEVPPASGSPVRLLQPQARVVRLRGQTALLTSLWEWCAGGESHARLLTGPGGQGKSRVAAELAARCQREGWAVTTLASQPGGTDPIATVEQTLGNPGGPMLVVVDYAETQPDVLRSMARQVTRTTVPVRLLLLARSAVGWWQDIQRADPSGLFGGATVLPVPSYALTDDARRAAFIEALTDLAVALRGLPPHQETDWPAIAQTCARDQLADPRYGSPLGIQLSALVTLLQHGPEPLDATVGGSAVRMAVAHEQRYWQRSAVAEQVSYTSAAQLREWVATANLYGASSVSQARAVIRLLLGLGERDRDSSHRVTAWLHGLYPGRSGDYWGFLEPDVIAEQVVGPALTRNPALLSTVLPDSTVTLMQARHAVEVASRACDGSPAVAGTIWAAVAARPALAPDAVKAATRAQGRAARALRGAMTQSLQRAEAPLEVLRAIVDGAPDLIHSLPVRDIESLRPVLGNFRRLTAFSRRYLPHLARVLHRLARALGQQGRFEDALAVLTEEVSAWQSLVDDGADQAGSGSAFEALAAALYEQASTLLSLCRFSEALPPMTEAAAIFQRLSDARPGAFRPELAAAILGRGIVLDDLDRPADAVGPVQVAIARYRALADHDPDKYQPCLADGLLRLSKLYRSLQQPRDALDASTEAVTLYHRLAGAEPARYRPLLAKVLNHRAADLGDLGAHALAQACLTDAISIYRELTDDRSPRYLSEIATAYYGLAVQSRHLGQGTQALYWLDQAIASYRRLARPEPDSQAILATALAHRGIELSALGQHQSAVDSVSEAVAIYQRLVNVDPGDATLRARLRATYLQLSELWRALGVPERAQRYQLEADLLAGSP